MPFIDRAQFQKRLVSVFDLLIVRRFDKRELLDIAANSCDVERFHLQDDAGEVRTQDFRLGKTGLGR